MRTQWGFAAAAAGVCMAVCAPAVLASADESPSEVISRLQDEGYTVNIDRLGTRPTDECKVTNVRNPQQVTQWVPYAGPGARNDNVLVEVVVSQSISVTLDCTR